MNSPSPRRKALILCGALSADASAWIEESGHFRIGDLARMSKAERQKTVDDMLTGGN